ncbi:hypothetical protein LTR62_001948 [Meristemomyces frigidus]|uniref:Rrp15p-domain-containing protein n=1 Tax=Meristemomyces frigidus TaxID=1508187 RepID=A0AAN7TJF8_9PEZI|nr:hypothetical protein LTR62_001948 [Meristemomyces frigidus]
MAPVQQKKRGRDGEEKERRPKKKFKKVKRVDYHSSDESDVEGAAYDAPRVSDVARVVKQGPVLTGENLKPILKRLPKEEVVEEVVVEALPEGDDDREDDEGSEDEVARNTAINSIPPPPDGMNEEGDDDISNDGAETLAGADLGDDDDNDEPTLDSSADDSDSESDDLSQTSTTRIKKKRNDPTAFATSITKILDTKLTSQKRPDPILSRSTTAAQANRELTESKLDAKARAQIRAEKKASLSKGRITDILGLAPESSGIETGKVLEEEKKLKKTAQRGVVKLFNAVRAAQVKGEEAAKQARAEGVVGMGQREERVREMSKQGFLDLISGGNGVVEA